MTPSVAVLIPCYNEELTVGRVVREFRQQLPEAAIYVFDNGSTDRTRAEAVGAGAIVRTVPDRGKGNVVRAMFASVDADIYVLVDGDATYPAASVRALLDPVLCGRAGMAVGSRLHELSASRFAWTNRLGNRLFALLASIALGTRQTDVLSGYRAFSREFVRAVSPLSRGFEIEIELTLAAARLGFRVVEVPVSLVPRPEGSHSKIRRISDGLAILRSLLKQTAQFRGRRLVRSEI